MYRFGLRLEAINPSVNFESSENRFVYIAEDNLEKALEGADLVLIAIEPGKTE